MERKCELKWEILSIINWGLLGILLNIKGSETFVVKNFLCTY